MGKPIRVLIIEDSEDDTLLILRELKKTGYDPSFERVHCAEDMAAALDAGGWDVIISDFFLPQFSGPAALALCQEKGVDAPFIVVSGRIGEEAAVEMMRAGAQDYVMKDHLVRLGPAVIRETCAAAERRGRKRAEMMMSHLAAVVECCDDAIISKTLDGRILSWNSGAERLYGYSAEEAIGRHISLLCAPERMDETVDLVDHVKKGRQVDRFETVRVRKDGGVVEVSVTISPIKDTDGRMTGASIVARDITARKRAEQERVNLIQELTAALGRVNTLSGLLPICASCKKIRNDQGYWEQVETYIKSHSNADFSHGICPDCLERLYPEHASRNSAA